jgi:hypothetical protein
MWVTAATDRISTRHLVYLSLKRSVGCCTRTLLEMDFMSACYQKMYQRAMGLVSATQTGIQE